MKSVEICLLGKRGRPQRKRKNIRQLVRATRRSHSQKPDEVRDRIVNLMGDLPRIELFARQCVPGWDAWGNQLDDNGLAPQSVAGQLNLFGNNEKEES